uniref:Uncharacterized protein n=1 Tax=Rousettus aegyptiacus TaxID=9407 RepID=A0A7J8JHE7_ROUAE|nr:hypothetical protein HJG63_010358 [Rousettus aegyptiacus]
MVELGSEPGLSLMGSLFIPLPSLGLSFPICKMSTSDVMPPLPVTVGRWGGRGGAGRGPGGANAALWCGAVCALCHHTAWGWGLRAFVAWPWTGPSLEPYVRAGNSTLVWHRCCQDPHSQVKVPGTQRSRPLDLRLPLGLKLSPSSTLGSRS